MHISENKINVMSNMPHRDHDIKARTFVLRCYVTGRYGHENISR